MIINLDVKIKVSTRKIINLNIEIEISTMKIIAGLVIEIDTDSIYTKIVLIEWDTTILLQVIVMGSKIWYLIYYLAIFIFENKYSLILYHEFFQLY